MLENGATKKEEWQKPVAETGKEKSGGEKRRKKKLEEENARKLGNPLDKFIVKRMKTSDDDGNEAEDGTEGQAVSNNSPVASSSHHDSELEDLASGVSLPAPELQVDMKLSVTYKIQLSF